MKIIRPIFWNDINFISLILYPITIITYFINYLKTFNKKKNFFIKTICVGNIYLGGTGKTPLAIQINKILRKKNPVFIKKNYKDQIDEQKLLKLNGNLICTNLRYNGVQIAENKKYKVGILDDGLQDKSINYNISIVCFNSTSGIGNGFLLPAGPLRENITVIKNYDAIFLNGKNKNKKLEKTLKNINQNIKIFYGKYIPKNLKKFNLNKKFIFFSGIGNPDEFEKTLKNYNFKIKEKFIFPDHYNFSSKDLNHIKKIAKNKKLEIITTEKDFMRISKKNRKNIKYLKIELRIQNISKFSKFLKDKL